MIGRNRRGSRQASWKMRISIAAAVLVGGGAIGAVAVAASSGGAPTAAKSAGYDYAYGGGNHRMSMQDGLNQAFTAETESVTKTVTIIHDMKPMTNYWNGWMGNTQFAAQRGVVVDVGNGFVGVRSSNGDVHWWGVSGATKEIDVASNSMGIEAMRGWSSMNMNNGWQHWYRSWNHLKPGDVVFIAGERVNGSLWAKVALFAMPWNYHNMSAMPFRYNNGMSSGYSNFTWNGSTAPSSVYNGVNHTIIDGQPAVMGMHS